MELSFRTYGMLGGFVTTAILLYVQVSVIPSGFGNLLYSVLGISAGVVLFVIECLDFWRICGNRVGCDCCEKLANKTACLVRYQQNYFYRGLLYALGGIGLIVVTFLIGADSVSFAQRLGFAGIVFTGIMYLVAWRREETTLGTGDYETIVDQGAKAGTGYATAGAKYAAQDPRVQAYAKEQAQNYAKQQASEALLGSGGMRAGEANYDNMESGDVAYGGTEI